MAAVEPVYITRRQLLSGLGGLALGSAIGGTLASSVGALTPPPTEPAAGVAMWRTPGGLTVAELAAQLSYDADRIFRFVADEVQYDPYAGILRGAHGTLWCRAGNSADQALLLAALLGEALVPTRFVIGSLDADAADVLATAATVDEDALRTRLAPVFTSTRDPVPEADLTLEERRLRDEVAAELPGMLELARSRVDAGVGIIASALDAVGVVLSDVAFELPPMERDRHVWLQYADGPAWIDLDPTMPDAMAGHAAAPVDETLDELPDDLHHRVQLRLVADVVLGGEPSPRELLAIEHRVADLVGVPISIVHAKPEGLAGIGAAIAGVLEGSLEYLPAVAIGDRVAIGRERISLSGGGGVLSALGEEGDHEGEALGEWLELTTVPPDGAGSTVRREIFDRVGAVARAAGPVDLADVEAVELVDLDERSPDEYLPLRAVWSLAVAGATVPADYFDQDPEIDDVFADLAIVSAGYFYLRDALQLEAVGARSHRIVTTGAGATALIVTPVAGDDGALRLRTELDILHREAASVPATPGNSAAHHPLLSAGVVAHVAERMGGGEAFAPREGVPLPTSVGRIFELAVDQGVPIMALTGPDALDRAARLDVSDVARLRIAAALEADLVVVVPERAVDVGGERLAGWWLVDSSTGFVRDQLENGRGAEPVEYQIPLTVEARAIDALVRLAGCVGKYAKYASVLFTLAGGIAGGLDAGAIAAGLGVASKVADTANSALGGTPASSLC